MNVKKIGHSKNVFLVVLWNNYLMDTFLSRWDLSLFCQIAAIFVFFCRSAEIVFCSQNCSDPLWEKKILVIEKNFWNKRMKAKNLQIFEVTRTIYSNSERSVPNFWNRTLFQLLLGYFSDLIQSHWCHTMVDCAKFWINYQQLAFLSSYSRWQLIQNLVPSTIMRCQCDIPIVVKKREYRTHLLKFKEYCGKW